MHGHAGDRSSRHEHAHDDPHHHDHGHDDGHHHHGAKAGVSERLQAWLRRTLRARLGLGGRTAED